MVPSYPWDAEVSILHIFLVKLESAVVGRRHLQQHDPAIEGDKSRLSMSWLIFREWEVPFIAVPLSLGIREFCVPFGILVNAPCVFRHGG
jgi:hypothetical protein